MAKTVLFLLSEGSEEMESTITIDVLRRAGIDVTVAGLQGAQPLLCSRNVVIKPDVALDDIKDKLAFDAIVLPGGNDGSHNFCINPTVQQLLKDYYNAKKLVAAICAAPTAILTAGIHKGGRITSYPTLESKFTDYKYLQDRVVVDANVITSRGPGTTIEFALAIVTYLVDAAKAKEVAGPMVVSNDVMATL
ncbi:DJ-1 protein [Anaeromyces robustus]|uniref:D-lactate dehydratase n=1 Tax=Anaeromyces robustus TaxID=1754192 RepID=A0A1Y1WPW7_9FUNG|nr:DJ-1 protein [Anaeromyces robustus]|eukprot:ORX75425.1 DJ-1 protein [Anaeromyces robustus]